MTSESSAKKATTNGYHAAAYPALRRPHGPLPLQATPIGNLEWASGHLDYAGSLIQKREKLYEELAKKYTAALYTNDRNHTEIVRLQDKNKTLDQEIKHLNAAVARQSNAYKSLDKAFDKSRNKAKAEKEVLTKELSATRKALEAAVSNVKSLAARLLEANADAHAAWESGKLKDQHDIEDHIALDKLHAALDKETEANALLREQIDEKIKQLLLTEQELQAAKDVQTVSAKEIATLNEQVEKLRQDIADRDSKIRNYESDILQLREETTRLTAEKSQLSQDLLNKTAELVRAGNDLVAGRQEADKLNKMISDNEATIKDNEATIKKISDQLKQQTDDKARLEENIKQLNDMIKKLNQHDEEDHRNISALSEEMSFLKKHDEEDHRKISALSEEMSTLKKEALANSERLEEEIGKLREQTKDLGERIGELNVHDAKDDVEIKRLKQKNADLEDKIKKATDDKKASDQLKGLVEDLQARLAEEEKRKLDEEAERKTKAAKDAAEDDAKKPMLPHEVKLANPIALVGSLKGAHRDVNDETFNINCSFEITLFNHASKKIYVSSNGLLTLDHAAAQDKYKQLPYRPWVPWPFVNPLPDHVLAPFWADLYIYKNTPQGIYYEETGSAPNRKLNVEWYVSREKNPKQYYHFSVTLEEAKRNVATFKYFKISENGKKCTIGVQGPKTALMYPFNDEKALPGTQVIFDTAVNTVKDSKFSIPAVDEKPAVKASAVTDVKPANAVSTTVSEVAHD